MALARTEQLHAKAAGLDTQAPEAVLAILADAQVEAARTVSSAVRDIARAARAGADALARGGRLVYAAAGSSGLMALADALELPGTFGIANDRVVVLLAGGAASLADLAGGYEDDTELAVRDIAATGLSAADCLIALSASGTTPYPLAAVAEAKLRGATTIGLANNAGSPLAERADIGIVLPTPPEVIAGSTRMGAGTAQKIALNMMSTMIAIHLGHVHDGYMVNLRADNIKLRDRAARIVAGISGAGADAARRHVDAVDGSVKHAVLLAAGAGNPEAAEALLAAHGGKLRAALAQVGQR